MRLVDRTSQNGGINSGRGYLAGGPDVYNLSGRERRSDGQAHLVLPLLSSVVMGCAYVQRSHFLLTPCTVLGLTALCHICLIGGC